MVPLCVFYCPGLRDAVFAVAVRDSGEAAAGGAAGLFSLVGTNWVQEFPRDGARSWAPADVRGLGFDARQRLWFFSPQGAGVRDGSSWKLFTGAEGLPYDDATTLAAGPGGEVWLGTRLGAIRYDGAPGHTGRGCDGYPMMLCAGSRSTGKAAHGLPRRRALVISNASPSHLQKRLAFTKTKSINVTGVRSTNM